MISAADLGALYTQIESVFRAIGSALMAIVHAIGAIIMAIVNGVIAVFDTIIGCLTCHRMGGRRRTTGRHHRHTTSTI
ncbi:uncharacterized protein E0L32_005596 [Thyridium curvatum]|uniref:Uncharacterized protein n=1 Tax=Thyridium curvatum TaxID=1093900 RepID=A0A507B492_9PEZI|nr:uncharacterized protein E0L32_005596 [Thyridium curvatum]TPX13896.1 hypothetical protein E0L32_005596 [Thyridium curvatum]